MVLGAGRYLESGSIYHYDLVFNDELSRMAKVARYAKISPLKCLGGHYFPQVGKESLSALPPDDMPVRIADLGRSTAVQRALPGQLGYGTVREHLPADGLFSASLQCAYFPDVIQAGQTARIEVRITNEGDGAWPIGPNKSSLVLLSYHWLWGDGTTAVFDGVRTPLAAPLKAGESTILFAAVVAPTVPGDYILRWDLLVENVLWFSSKGLKFPQGTIRIVDWMVSEERIAGVRYQIGLSQGNSRRQMRSKDRHRPLPSPFIVGTGRCGTTLLRLMLDSHPEMAIGPETHTFPKAYDACKGASDPVGAFLRTVTSSVTWKDFHLREQELSEALSKVIPFHLGECYRVFYNLYARNQGKARWGDKTPDYLHCMADIQEQIPEAHFIHLVRDGRDVALSIKDLWWGPSTIEECANWWRGKVQHARNLRFALANYLEIRYEDLVRDPSGSLREICRFISLDWNDQMLTYYLRAGERLKEYDSARINQSDQSLVSAEQLQGIHELVKSPPRTDRVELWRSGMSEADLRAFENVAGELLLDLGYSLHE